MSTIREEIMANALADAEKAIKIAETKAAILESLPEGLPVPFIHVHPLFGRVASVTFDVKTRKEVHAIYSALRPGMAEGFVIRDAGTASVRCTDLESAKESTPVYAILETNQRNAEFSFYWLSPAGVVEICVRLPVHLFGEFRKSDRNAKTRFTMDWHPKPSTCELFRAVIFAAAYPQGPYSGKTTYYAFFEAWEVDRQFLEIEGE